MRQRIQLVAANVVIGADRQPVVGTVHAAAAEAIAGVLADGAGDDGPVYANEGGIVDGLGNAGARNDELESAHAQLGSTLANLSIDDLIATSPTGQTLTQQASDARDAGQGALPGPGQAGQPTDPEFIVNKVQQDSQEFERLARGPVPQLEDGAINPDTSVLLPRALPPTAPPSGGGPIAAPPAPAPGEVAPPPEQPPPETPAAPAAPAPGPAGPQGPQGDQGPAGPPGRDGQTYVIVF